MSTWPWCSPWSPSGARCSSSASWSDGSERERSFRGPPDGTMSPKDVFVDLLLGVAVATEALSAVGLIVMPNLMDRLHFLGPAASVGPALVAGAVVTKEALNHQGIEAVLIALFLLVFGPVLTHATARAARIRRFE